MGAPLSRIIFGTAVPDAQRMRDIENHYQLEMIAESTAQIAQFQADSLLMQAASAMQTNRALARISFGVESLNYRLDDIADGVANVEYRVRTLNETVNAWLSHISDQMNAHQQTMDGIADTLIRPLETPVQEIRRHADHALRSGMAAPQVEQAEWYRDAMGLLESAAENPVGKQDYVVWFQIGWLRWKIDSNLGQAEQSFARAVRLSTPVGDIYHIESLRHLAHIRYLRGDFEGAHDAIGQALARSSEQPVLFDAARYAATIDRIEEAEELLDRCIDQEPVTILSMLAEPDFAKMNDSLEKLATRRWENKREEAMSALDAWEQLLDDVHTSAQRARCEIAVPSHWGEQAIHEGRDILARADYLTVLDLENEAWEAYRGLIRTAQGTLEKERALLAQTVSKAESDLQNAVDSAAKEKERAAQTKQRAIESTHYQAASAYKALGHELLWFIPYMIQEGWLPALGITVGFVIAVGMLASMIEVATRPGLLDRIGGRMLAFSPIVGVGSVAAYRLIPKIVRAVRASRTGIATPQTADSEFCSAVARAEAGLAGQLPQLEERLRSAVSAQQRLEKVLSFMRDRNLTDDEA